MSILVNAYSTFCDPPPLGFPHENVTHRDHSDPDFSGHLNGFIGFVLDGGQRDMTSSLYAVMRHIDRVHHQYTFEVDEKDIDAMSDWGWASNSLFFLPDGTVRDPAGAVLVDPETGAPAEEAEIPFPADARARKVASESRLEELGVTCPDVLPPVIGEREVIMRAADDVAWRAIALFIVAVRAESVASQRPIPTELLKTKSPMAFEAISPIESEFLYDTNPEQRTVVNMAWKYECLNVLQWALGFHEELKFANEICDVTLVAQTMVDHGDRKIVNMARLRPVSQILEALDFNQRLLWMAREAQRENQELPAGIDGGVIVERQHALNWLIRFENADWDDVDTPS